ncbi:MAG: hypothetical protein WAX69_07765, partial [Victivallales bacterium]
MQRINSGTTRTCNTSVGTLKIKGNTKLQENDKTSKYRLTEPQIIYTPTRMLKLDGDVWFHKNGKIRSGFLSEPHIVDTISGMLKIKG